jgi:hypothetical protein
MLHTPDPSQRRPLGDPPSATPSLWQLYWQRAGQRCVYSIFGPDQADWEPPPSSRFGPCDLITDPIEEAARRVMRSARLKEELPPSPDVEALPGAFSKVGRTSKCNIALRMMDSVEAWLREGTYAGMQLHRRNKGRFRAKQGGKRQSVLRVCRPLSNAEALEERKHMVRRSLEEGMEQSIREMVASGEAQNEDDARSQAYLLRSSVEAMLNGTEADEEAFIKWGRKFGLGAIPQEEPRSDTSDSDGEFAECPNAADEEGGRADDEEQDLHDLDPDGICLEAYRASCSCMAAAMCQGPMVHHQFNMSIFLCYEGAVNTCANCDQVVHVLEACFLTTRYGCCLRCRRPRCMSCAEAMARKAEKGAKANLPRDCRRCRQAERRQAGK